MPRIDAHEGWLLIFRASNESAAAKSLVNLTSPECEGKQKHGNSDKAKHEPEE